MSKKKDFFSVGVSHSVGVAKRLGEMKVSTIAKEVANACDLLSKSDPDCHHSTIVASFLGHYLHHHDYQIILNAAAPCGFHPTLTMPSMIIYHYHGKSLTLFLIGGAQPFSKKNTEEEDRRSSMDSYGPFSQDVDF